MNRPLGLVNIFFLGFFLAALGGGLCVEAWSDAGQRKADRPNIALIITDQQFAECMSCAMGSRWLHTPNMDWLAANGVRFTRAYAANPLCVPSRTAMFTGYYPHQTGIQTNARRRIDPERFRCLGRIFRDAGYETAFFGKWHMPYDVKRTDDHGFELVVGRPARYSGRPAAEFIRRRHEGPFLVVASFLNPHNICQWSRAEKLPGGPIGDPPPPDQCPPPLPNRKPPEDETDPMAHMRRAYQAHRLFPVGDFTLDKWRQYRWAYYRLVEKVDQRVGEVLQAIRESGLLDDTVVVLLSDHGECHGAHRWNQKTVFYEESTRVPLIISRQGHTAAGTCNALVQTGIDLLPTLCDLAGIQPAGQLPGRSLKRLALGQATKLDRPYIVVSNKMVQCEPVDGVLWQPDGRMVRSDRYKYCLYSVGLRRESLFDLKNDPGETVNVAGRPDYQAVLKQHRDYLRQFARREGDALAMRMLQAVGLQQTDATRTAPAR